MSARRRCPCCGRAAFQSRAGWECLGCGWIAASPDPDWPPPPACPGCGEPVTEADGWACGCEPDGVVPVPGGGFRML